MRISGSLVDVLRRRRSAPGSPPGIRNQKSGLRLPERRVAAEAEREDRDVLVLRDAELVGAVGEERPALRVRRRTSRARGRGRAPRRRAPGAPSAAQPCRAGGPERDDHRRARATRRRRTASAGRCRRAAGRASSRQGSQTSIRPLIDEAGAERRGRRRARARRARKRATGERRAASANQTTITSVGMPR